MDGLHLEGQALRHRHPVAWYGVAFGALTGGVLAAAGVGKVTQGQEMLVVAGAGVAACCYAFAGALAAGRSFRARDGLKAGLLAGVISAAISVPVDLICTQVFMSVYLPHMEAMQETVGYYTPGPHDVVTPAMVFGYEVQGVTYGVIGTLVAGVGLGWLGGYVGSGMRLGWPVAENPAPKAPVLAAPPAQTGPPQTPSGPHWELAHLASRPADRPDEP